MNAEPLTLDERAGILDRVIQAQGARGWRVASQTSTNAQLVHGWRPNHLLHLLLTLITFGIWAVVWIIVSLTGGEKHLLVRVDEYGAVFPPALTPPLVEPGLTVDERREVLENALRVAEVKGWRVVSKTDVSGEVQRGRLPLTSVRKKVTVDHRGEAHWFS